MSAYGARCDRKGGGTWTASLKGWIKSTPWYINGAFDHQRCEEAKNQNPHPVSQNARGKDGARDFHCSASSEDNLGVEERAGYTRGDGDEVVLSGEDFHLPGAGKFGQVYGPSAADVRGRHFIGCDGGKGRKQLAGVDYVAIQKF